METRRGHSPTPRRPPSIWLLIAVLAIISSACSARGGVPRPFPGAALPPGTGGDAPTQGVAPPPARAEVPTDPRAPASLVATALELRGVPYAYGGSTPSGFDCSGFVQYVFGRHGTALPREVRDQYRIGRRVDMHNVQPGDLVFFQTAGRGASHVGVVIADGHFVHAPSSRGVVRVERYDGSYWRRRVVGARRVAHATPVAQRGPPGAVRARS